MRRGAVLFILFLIIFAGEGVCADPWSRADLALAGTFTLSRAIDLGQTLYIAKRPEEFRERNTLLLSEHPSPEQVVAVFAGTTAVVLAVAHILPVKARRGWLAGATVVSVGVVVHNAAIGARIDF